MSFSKLLAEKAAIGCCANTESENGLVESFVEICQFLEDNPDCLSWRSKLKLPSLCESEGLGLLAEKYFSAYRKSDFPTKPSTIPDEIVSIVMQQAYGYSAMESERIKQEHQQAMSAENCVGALLEKVSGFGVAKPWMALVLW